MTDYYRDDDDRPAPPTVVAAVAVGTTPVPFLAVYAVLFLVHGSVHPVIPPDITSTTRGEFWCGVVAAVLFVLCSVSLIWAVSGRRRWPFAAMQVVLFAAALYFLIDGTKGGDFVSGLIVAATLAALVLVFLPMSWPYFGVGLPMFGRRSGAAAEVAGERDVMPAGSAAVSDTAPATARVAGRHGRPSPDISTPGDPRV